MAFIQIIEIRTSKADELLATSDEEWERLKPIMGENDPSFNDKTFDALRRRYREGIPERSARLSDSFRRPMAVWTLLSW